MIKKKEKLTVPKNNLLHRALLNRGLSVYNIQNTEP